jgi:primosomal protein N' (replication factor Y)
MSSIAKIVVQVALDKEFDYRIPGELQGQVFVGSHVVVPFGRNEVRGFVVKLTDASERKDLKEIVELVEQRPLITETTMKLAKWMAEYYAAPIERAVRTVLPGAVRKRHARFKKQLACKPTPLVEDKEELGKLRTRAPKQYDALQVLISAGSMLLSDLANAAKTTTGTIRALEKKGFVKIGEESIMRDPLADLNYLKTEPLKLMPEQEEAFTLVKQSVDTLDPPVVLLYGVTGSGKTEIYLQAIDHVLKQGKGAIVLVPEISLTPQTVERFKGRFGEDIAVLHSHLSSGERHDEWHRVHRGQARIAIGARSALFAPVHDLGLIVVDEEHENSYKQDEAPRYNARDVAVMRGRMEGCSVLLGTATPSIESYHNATIGKYGLARLTHRVDHRKMPAVRVIDLRIEAERAGRVNVLSGDLVEAVKRRLDRAEQTILFLNRRGYSTSLVCPKCGFVVECAECSVAMTYHRSNETLCCHICGLVRDVPKVCPNPECKDPAIRYAGVGTQRVEAVVKKVFPQARVERMDSDTTTRKDVYHRVLNDFKTGKIDILIGTQMIAKGLHFPNVTLVGVISADTSLHMPDFRAGERTFQLLTQVAGRAGRGDVSGEVLVQTYTPFHVAIQAARELNYEGFVDQELEFRKELRYPPFTHMALLTVRGRVEEQVVFAAEAYVKQLRKLLSPYVGLAGPTPAPIARARGYYRYHLMMRSKSAKAMAMPLKEMQKSFKWPPEVTCQIDMDALSLL